MEPSIPFHTLVKLVDSEGITKKKFALGLPLGNNNVTSKLESQNFSGETYDSKTEAWFTQTGDPNNESNSQTLKYCFFSQVQSLRFKRSSQTTRREIKKRNCCSRSQTPPKSFNQYFKTYWNQIHPKEQPSSYPANYYSRNSYDSRNRSNSRN